VSGPQPEPLDEHLQQLVTALTRETARWLIRAVLPRIEEHWSDPEERWEQLKEALRRYATAQ